MADLIQTPGPEPIPVNVVPNEHPIPVAIEDTKDPVPVLVQATHDTPIPVTFDGEIADYKARRPVTLIAAFGIIAIAGASVGGLIYDLTVNGNSQSLTQLGTLATLGLGGLLALSGNVAGKDK